MENLSESLIIGSAGLLGLFFALTSIIKIKSIKKILISLLIFPLLNMFLSIFSIIPFVKFNSQSGFLLALAFMILFQILLYGLSIRYIRGPLKKYEIILILSFTLIFSCTFLFNAVIIATGS